MDFMHCNSIINIIYICCLCFFGIYYNYSKKSIKIIMKHYLYIIILHILYNIYIYMGIIIKYIISQSLFAIIIISMMFMFIKIIIK